MTNRKGRILGRRRFNKAVAGTVLIGSLASRTRESRAQQGTVIVDEDFEGTPTGTLPDGWTVNGNDDQEVVDGTAASGGKSLRLSGSYGGCWEAIGNRELEIPDTGSMTISLSMKPTTNGSPGCHGNKNGKLKLGTDDGSWSAGSGVGLVTFYSDGTVEAGDASGSYRVDDWNDVKVVYERGGGSVTQTIEINQSQLSAATRDVTDFEDNISYFEVHSGDYTLYVDGLLVEAGTGGTGNGQTTAEDESDQSDVPEQPSDQTDIPEQGSGSDQPQNTEGNRRRNEDDALGEVATMFRQSVEDPGATGFLLGGGVLGGAYLAYRRRKSDDGEKAGNRSSNYCTKCGNELHPSNTFCGNCGMELDETEETNKQSKIETERDIHVSEYGDLSVREVLQKGPGYQINEARLSETGEPVRVVTPPTEGGQTLDVSRTENFLDDIEPWTKMEEHPNLLSVYGHGTEPLPWLAVESAEYPSLREAADDLSESQKIEVLSQICEAVHHVHRYGIVYENLSPEGVKIADDTQVKLAGPLDYLSGGSDTEVTERDVIYRIGNIGKYLLTSSGDVPEKVERGIDKSLSEDPNERHETVLHFRDGLEQAYEKN